MPRTQGLPGTAPLAAAPMATAVPESVAYPTPAATASTGVGPGISFQVTGSVTGPGPGASLSTLARVARQVRCARSEPSHPHAHPT